LAIRALKGVQLEGPEKDILREICQENQKGDQEEPMAKAAVTNFIWSYLYQFFDDSHGLKASLKPLRRPFDRYQSRLEAINDGQDIRQINW